ncbi:RNA polymerase sigma factor [Cohnella endophytica]|uniref:RNA polymerase sigma factor n=1 Tax=Cohnella endophytica TaxID=2419778 RepID=A0A494XTP7_9BACL|nr:RNA polymerase sigma factor [Cohnella endophytica]RKP53031.1 RNA polymerase sigma factor [Cohnella endophytica]
MTPNPVIAATEVGLDRSAVEGLQGALSRYCLSLTESRWDAEDLAQEAWLKAIDSAIGLNHANPEAYLLRIARNAWIDRSRRQSALARMISAEQASAKTAKAEMPDQGAIVLESIFQALLAHMSPLQRTVFLLRDLFGYSSAESASLLGTSEGAIKAALHRARLTLPSVREAIDKEMLAAPKEEGLSEVLRALATAYRIGDIDALLALMQHNESEFAPAIALLQSRRLQTSSSASARRGTLSPSMAFAA